MTRQLPHPVFYEALALHQSSHRIPVDDYQRLIGDLLDCDDGCLASGLRGMLVGLADSPLCLVHAVFLAGVLYGRDTDARIACAACSGDGEVEREGGGYPAVCPACGGTGRPR